MPCAGALAGVRASAHGHPTGFPRTFPLLTNATIRLRWTPELADLWDAYQARRRRGLEGWMDRSMSVLLLASAFLLALGGYPAWAVAFGVVGALSWFNLPTRLRLFLTWRSSPALRSPTEATASGAGLRYSATDWTGELDWQRFARFVETERSFVLFVGQGWRNPMVVLPKRGLAGDDPERLRALLTERVKPAPSAAQ